MRNRKIFIALAAVLALGLIAAGCGGDDESSPADEAQQQLEGAETPTSAEEAQQQAEEALENAPQDIDEAIQQCLDNVESSGLPDEQKENMRQLCESGGAAANEALENAESLQDSLGNGG